MSKNSKNARKKQAAKQITATHKNGGKGPAQTKKCNEKKNTWYNASSRTFWRKTDGGKKKSSAHVEG